MPIEIRSLQPEEWSTYRAVRLAALKDSPDAFGGSYDKSAAYPEALWREWCGQPSWFAFDGTAPVGMVRVFAAPAEELPELVSMWVAPDVRGRTVATDLVATVIDWARTSGAMGVRLFVVDGNARAQRFYERMGFCDTGVREPLSGERTEIGMELRFG